MSTTIPAVILAGGRAERMGGGDKSLKPLAGRPMLAHVIDRLAPQAGPLALNANGDPARFDTFGLDVVADTIAGFVGPLAGILAGMEWAARTGSQDCLISAAGDTPFFPENLVAGLSAARGGEKIVLASSGGKTHPVFGLWPLALREDLFRFLASGETYRVNTFVERNDHAIVEFPMTSLPGRTVDPFFNVNTLEDLAEAEAISKELRR